MLNDFTFATLVLVQDRSVVKVLCVETAQKYMASEWVLIYILLILMVFIFCRQLERILENISASPIIFEFFMRNIISDLFHHCKGHRDWFRKKNKNSLFEKLLCFTRCQSFAAGLCSVSVLTSWKITQRFIKWP